MSDSSVIVNDYIFLALAVAATGCILASCFVKKAKWSMPAFLAGAAACGALYFMLDAFYCGLIHIVVFGGGGTAYFLMTRDDGAREAAGRDRPGPASALLVAAAVFALLVFISFSINWDAAAAGWGDGFSGAAIIGDSMASRWVLPFLAAAVLMAAALAGSFLVLKGGERK